MSIPPSRGVFCICLDFIFVVQVFGKLFNFKNMLHLLYNCPRDSFSSKEYLPLNTNEFTIRHGELMFLSISFSASFTTKATTNETLFHQQNMQLNNLRFFFLHIIAKTIVAPANISSTFGY